MGIRQLVLYPNQKPLQAPAIVQPLAETQNCTQIRNLYKLQQGGLAQGVGADCTQIRNLYKLQPPASR